MQVYELITCVRRANENAGNLISGVQFLINVNIFHLSCVKLRIRLENFKGVFARMWFNIAMTSDRLSFALVEINKSYSFTLPPWKNLCHRWSRDQPRPGSLFPTTREAEERDPGNEVGSLLHFLTKYRSSAHYHAT